MSNVKNISKRNKFTSLKKSQIENNLSYGENFKCEFIKWKFVISKCAFKQLILYSIFHAFNYILSGATVCIDKFIFDYELRNTY